MPDQTPEGYLRRELLGVALLFLLALALRLHGLGDESYWIDELISVTAAQGGSPDPNHPPLYFWLLSATLPPEGGEAAARLPSAFFGALSVPLLYGVGRRLVGPRASLAGALLFALSWYHIYWSQIARMYTLFTFLALLQVYAFLRLREGRGYRILYVAAGVLGFYTHYFMVLVTGALALVWGLHHPRPRWREFLGLHVAIGAACLPLLPFFLVGVGIKTGDVVPGLDISPTEFLSITFQKFGVSHPLLTIAFLFCALWGLRLSLRERRPAGLLFGLWLFLPLAIGVLLVRTIAVTPRLFLFSLPPFLLLAARGVMHTGRAPPPREPEARVDKAVQRDGIGAGVPAALLVLLLALSILSLVGLYGSQQNVPFRDISSDLEGRVAPGETVVLVSAGDRRALQHYYSRGPVVYFQSLPELSARMEGKERLLLVVVATVPTAHPQFQALKRWLQANATPLRVEPLWELHCIGKCIPPGAVPTDRGKNTAPWEAVAIVPRLDWNLLRS